MLLFKRDSTSTLEAAAATIATADPKTFAELLAIAEGEELVAELGNTLFRGINLLQQSLAYILESGVADKPALIRESLDQFSEAIDADLPAPTDLAKALGAVSPDPRQQLEDPVLSNGHEEKRMISKSDVMAATAGAKANLVKTRDALDDEFDATVRKAQREGETFAQAYARLLDSDTGREFYSKRFAFHRKAAVITKIGENALRSGRFAPDDAGIEKSGESRQALEKQFDDFVAQNRRDSELTLRPMHGYSIHRRAVNSIESVPWHDGAGLVRDDPGRASERRVEARVAP